MSAERTDFCGMRPISAVLIVVGLVVAGGGLGFLVQFDRRLDSGELSTSMVPVNAGIALGFGVAMAVIGVLGELRAQRLSAPEPRIERVNPESDLPK